MSRCTMAYAVPVLGLALSLAGVAQHKGGAGASAVLGLSIASPTVPPGGLLQVQVSLTEPKPIIKGHQTVAFASTALRGATLAAPLMSAAAVSPDATSAGASPLGGVRDVALFSPDGAVSGVAVLGSSGFQVFFRSPLTAFGTNPDSPVITMSIPVKGAATRGDSVFLNFDPNTAQWFSPSATSYPLEFKSGKMLVGGTLSVIDVQPGEGLVRAGDVVTVTGIGFDATTSVQVDGTTVASTKLISTTELHFTTADSIDLRGRRIRVSNRKNEIVTYFPSGRTPLIEPSGHQLVAGSFPLFALKRWSTAYFRPVQSGNVFTALALQNTQSTDANVTLRLRNKAGVLLDSINIVVPANTHLVNDLADFFPGASYGGTSLQVKTDVSLQMLAMQGNDALGTMLPVDPLTAP